MKSASVMHHWAKVYRRSYPMIIENIHLEGVTPFGSQEIALGAGIIAICGANGVGKSTLLQAVRDTLLQQLGSERDPRSVGRATSRATITLSAGETRTALSLPPATESDAPVLVHWLDPMTSFLHYQQFFADLEHTTDVLDGLEAKVATEVERATASYVLGRDYNRIETYEIPDFTPDDEPLPYFRVQAEGVSYDSPIMGLGELSVHAILWQMARAREGEILLIEEPETFIAPFSQRHLLDVLAREAATKGVQVLFTTHSPDLLRQVPLSHTRLVVREGSSVRVRTPEMESELRQTLGVDILTRGVLFVEDRAAREFCKCVLNLARFRWSREFELTDAGSASAVIAALNAIPERVQRIAFVGILDGDQRTVFHKCSRPVVYLPGDHGPESLLRSSATTHLAILTATSGLPDHEVARAVNSTTGLDPHDWLEEMGRQLGMTYEQTMFALCAAWIKTAGATKIVHDFLQNLEKAVETAMSRNPVRR